MLQASYNSPKYWNGWTSTTIAVIYNGFSGSRYSLTINEKNLTSIVTDNMVTHCCTSRLKKNSDQMLFTSVDSKGEPLKMTAEESRAAFKQWLENDSYAKNHRGQFAERNSNLSKWEHQIDFALGAAYLQCTGRR